MVEPKVIVFKVIKFLFILIITNFGKSVQWTIGPSPGYTYMAHNFILYNISSRNYLLNHICDQSVLTISYFFVK